MRAAAAAIGAEPKPASLEKTPRATPQRIAVNMLAIIEPPTPPATASVLNAIWNIIAKPAGTFLKLTMMIITVNKM